jgi:hypothetical protein
MNDHYQPPPTPSSNDPKWSIKSLKIPVIFIIIYLLLVFLNLVVFVGGNAGLLGIFVLPFYVFYTARGVIFAIRSFAQKERFTSLSWLALLLNAGPFLLLIVLYFFG